MAQSSGKGPAAASGAEDALRWRKWRIQALTAGPQGASELIQQSEAYRVFPAASGLGESLGEIYTAVENFHIEAGGVAADEAFQYQGRAQGISWRWGPKKQERNKTGTTLVCRWANWWFALAGMLSDGLKSVRSRGRCAETRRLPAALTRHWGKRPQPKEGETAPVLLGFDPTIWEGQIARLLDLPALAIAIMRLSVRPACLPA